jgi:hypothetical protein
MKLHMFIAGQFQIWDMSTIANCSVQLFVKTKHQENLAAKEYSQATRQNGTASFYSRELKNLKRERQKVSNFRKSAGDSALGYQPQCRCVVLRETPTTLKSRLLIW